MMQRTTVTPKSYGASVATDSSAAVFKNSQKIESNSQDST